jgi:hypothetical protein
MKLGLPPWEIASQARNVITTNIWTCYPPSVEGGDPNCIVYEPVQVHVLPNFSYEDWHTYAVEWDRDKIIYYVDGIAIRTVINSNIDNYGASIIDPVRIMLGSGVASGFLLDNSYFEEYKYVDYVKVYQLKCDKNTAIAQIPNFNTYNYAVKKYISLSNTTTIPPNSNITLRAAEYIELTHGFEVPLGSELYLDVSPCGEVVNVGQIHNKD